MKKQLDYCLFLSFFWVFCMAGASHAVEGGSASSSVQEMDKGGTVEEVLWESKALDENLLIEEGVEGTPVDRIVIDGEEQGIETRLRNPFAPTALLVNVKMTPKKKNVESDLAFTPGPVDVNIPKMRLKAHLKGEHNELLALLEIEGAGTYIVREGDTVGLSELGQDAVLKIKKIDRLHLVVESGRLGQVIIVR